MTSTAPAYFAEYNSGAAMAPRTFDLFANGSEFGPGNPAAVANVVRLTDEQFAAIVAYSATLPSTPGNNVWD
jgi:hypothetical protein